jgi:hypothetical protein
MKKLIILLLLLTGCKKAEDRACWKFVGEQSEKIVQLEKFKVVEINPYVIVNLVQDSVNYCKIIGGENVINLIKTDVKDGKLSIENENKCSFLRSAKKKITVEIHFVSLKKIVFQGSESVRSLSTINSPDLAIDLKETSGTMDLDLNVDLLFVSAEPSWSNFNLSGIAKNVTLVVKGNAYCDTRKLTVQDRLVVNSRTVGDCYVNGNTNHLKCETNGSGNVYYIGSPGLIEWNDYATGKLLQAP